VFDDALPKTLNVRGSLAARASAACKHDSQRAIDSTARPRRKALYNSLWTSIATVRRARRVHTDAPADGRAATPLSAPRHPAFGFSCARLEATHFASRIRSYRVSTEELLGRPSRACGKDRRIDLDASRPKATSGRVRLQPNARMSVLREIVTGSAGN